MSTRNDLHKGTSPEPGVGYTHAWVDAKNALKAVFALPPDLLAFAHTASVSDVAKVLYTSRRTAYRLRQGYWPADARGLGTRTKAVRGHDDAHCGNPHAQVEIGNVRRGLPPAAAAAHGPL